MTQEYNIPDCTLTTCCLHINGKRSVEELTKQSLCVLRLPVYLVVYCDKITFPYLFDYRKACNLTDVTIFKIIELSDMWSYSLYHKVLDNRKNYFPTKDERTNELTHLITINKFDFVLQTIELNPFHTSKFGWIDCLLGENQIRICKNYKENIIPYILDHISELFHIVVINVNDKKYLLEENKKEYYQEYRWVVAGGFFTCGSNIGTQILNRLKEIAVSTTNLGYGHGEEMLYIEILEEFHEQIAKGYGDYDFILNNFLKPTENLENIYFDIIQNYLKFGYYKEGIQCIEQVLEQLVEYNAYVNPDIYINILIDYVIAIYYLNPRHSNCYIVVNKIFLMCYKHPILKHEIKQHIGRLDVYLKDLNITKPDFLK
jgi:tetratricopeptide (TPR) repeat protein